MTNLGLKIVILNSAIVGGIMSHYGFPTDNWIWYRADLPWWGNLSLYTTAFMIGVGTYMKD